MITHNQSFYIKTEDNKPLPRITINLEMANEEKIKKWTKEQKQDALIFINKVEKDFNQFKKDLIDVLNS